MIASNTTFDSRGEFSDKLSDEHLAEIEYLRVVAMTTDFEIKIAITGFVRTTATR